MRSSAAAASSPASRPSSSPRCSRSSPSASSPSEARFLGAPVDYVIFDGLGSGLLREVVLVEVKTGKSKLTPNEREVEQADHGRAGCGSR